MLAGCTNQEAIDASDVVILAIPFRFLVSTLEELHGLEGKVVITPVNPIHRTEFFSFAPPPEGSAAMLVKKLLPPDAKVWARLESLLKKLVQNVNLSAVLAEELT